MRLILLFLFLSIQFQSKAIKNYFELERYKSDPFSDYMVISKELYVVDDNWNVSKKSDLLEFGDKVVFSQLRKGTIDGMHGTWGYVSTYTHNERTILPGRLILNMKGLVELKDQFYVVQKPRYLNTTYGSELLISVGDTVLCESLHGQKKILNLRKLKGNYLINYELITFPTDILTPINHKIGSNVTKVKFESQSVLKWYYFKASSLFYFVILIVFLLIWLFTHPKITFRLKHPSIIVQKLNEQKVEFRDAIVYEQDRYEEILSSSAYDRSVINFKDSQNRLYSIYAKKNIPVFNNEKALLYCINDKPNDDVVLGYIFKSLKHFYPNSNSVLRKLIKKSIPLGFKFSCFIYFAIIFFAAHMLGLLFVKSFPVSTALGYQFPVNFFHALGCILIASLLYYLTLRKRYQLSIIRESVILQREIERQLSITTNSLI